MLLYKYLCIGAYILMVSTGIINTIKKSFIVFMRGSSGIYYLPSPIQIYY